MKFFACVGILILDIERPCIWHRVNSILWDNYPARISLGSPRRCILAGAEHLLPEFSSRVMLVSIINLLTLGVPEVLGIRARRSKSSLVVFIRDSRLRDCLLPHRWVIPRLRLLDTWIHLSDLDNSLLAGVVHTSCARALDVRLRNAVDVIADLFIATLFDPPLSRDHSIAKVVSLDPSDWSV